MELERIASDLYRGFAGNADKLAREMERLRSLLEETGAAVMMEIEKEKYRKDKDADKIKEYRKIYRGIRRELDSIDTCISRFSLEQSLMKSERERGAQGRIDYDAYRVDETVPYTLDSVLTNKKPSAFSLYGHSLESDPDLQGRKRPYFSRDGAGLDTPAKIPDADLYVETHFSARYFKKMISKLLQKYNIPEEAVLIYLKKDFTALHEETARVRSAAPSEETKEQAGTEEQLSFSFDSEGNWNG